MDVWIMSHTSVQFLAQIRPDGNLHMIFLPQFHPDGAHNYRGTFWGPAERCSNGACRKCSGMLVWESACQLTGSPRF